MFSVSPKLKILTGSRVFSGPASQLTRMRAKIQEYGRDPVAKARYTEFWNLLVSMAETELSQLVLRFIPIWISANVLHTAWF